MLSPVDYTPEKLEEINRERVCFVAEADSVIVGTAALEGDALVTFFVDPSQQRRGIGATAPFGSSRSMWSPARWDGGRSGIAFPRADLALWSFFRRSSEWML